MRLPEYPPVVLSMDATTQDTFETEVRKRCFVVYKGASLPDDAPEFRELSKMVSRLKHDFTTSLYREYLRRILARLQQEESADFLSLSSGVLQDLISEHGEGGLPDWCRVTTMDEHRRGRHDKVREDLCQLRIFDNTSWENSSILPGGVVARSAEGSLEPRCAPLGFCHIHGL